LRNKLAHYQRSHVLIVDLCRYRDYADILVAAELKSRCSLRFLPVLSAGVSA
jgi:hypothetical protein